ncbi:hypothetical protein GcM1_241113 [Golovinomyces cichoracearum]|uniref:Uncharacterized protein n=1 Tax=Golovinomyces cichoracearum TaxID=62708 RepID=A0A420IHU8_9PEZI|nr:hypothetical protein GcM1_241113 [Golovinomyces cichoracearum]
MPILQANFVGFSRNGAGLRYKDVSNSNWRDKYRSQISPCIDEERRWEKVNCKESAEEMTYEIFTGCLRKPKKSVKFEDPNKDLITLESFLNEEDLRKRERPINIEDLLNEEEYAPKIRKKSHKRSQKLIQHLREIVELSLLDLFQISPVTIYQNAFRVPVTVKTIKDAYEVKLTLPLSRAQADQGSDMIIATIGFLKKLGLPIKSLVGRGFDELTMNVADGSSARLTQYSTFEIGALGIWREVEAFVRPCSKENFDHEHLLLGIPWLHAVHVKINIR